METGGLMVTNIRVSLLGEFRVFEDGQPLAGRVSPRVQALLAKLVLSGSRRQSRQHLAFVFWPESTEKQARTNLRQLLHLFRTTLPECAHCVLEDRSSLFWNPDESCTGDVAEFLRAIETVDRSMDIEDAMLLYAGDLLPHLYYDWLDIERERLRNAFTAMLETAIVESETHGNNADATRYVSRLLKHDPFHEEGYRAQMRIASKQGDLAGVVRAYRKCRAVWAREFGVEPSELTRALYNEACQNSKVQEASVGEDPGGGRRLRGLLPDLPSAIVGRDDELAAITNLVSEPAVRLVSLVGPGGIGKTRLAIEVARRLKDDFAHGVWFVDLAAVTIPDDVIGAIAGALAVETSGRDGPEYAFIDFVRNRQLLLLLDNFEQVLGAAGMVARLLRSTPHLTILVTSRAPLRIDGEHEFQVDGLEVPPLIKPGREKEWPGLNPAVQLFVERARSTQPQFQLTTDNVSDVVRICQQLDGIPLAIELAAGRVRVLGPAQIRDRLTDPLALLTTGRRDAPARHQTLREMIGWSHRLLSPEEKQMFARNAVFSGGATIEMIERVCCPPSEANDPKTVLDYVDNLVTHNLLKRSDPYGSSSEFSPRFGMLETIREYALERLHDSGELNFMLRRHAEYFVELAEGAEDDLAGGPNRQIWIRKFLSENDNLRGALTWAIPDGDAVLGLRLASALGWYWFARGYATEGRRWLSMALDAAPSAVHGLRAKALNHLGGLSIQQAEHEVAAAHLEQSLRIYRHLDDHQGIALTLFRLGQATRYSGNSNRAISHFEECLAVSVRSETNDKGPSGFNRGLPLTHLGLLLVERGELASGIDYLRAAHQLGMTLNDQVVTGGALVGLGWVDNYTGDTLGAISRGREALRLYRATGHFTGSADALIQLGWAMLSSGDAEQARSMFQECLQMVSQRNGRSHIADCLAGIGAVESATAEGLEDGITLLAASEHLRKTVGTPFFPSQQAFQSHRDAVRASVDDSSWQSLCRLGTSMSLEESIALALASPSTAQRI